MACSASPEIKVSEGSLCIDVLPVLFMIETIFVLDGKCSKKSFYNRFGNIKAISG